MASRYSEAVPPRRPRHTSPWGWVIIMAVAAGLLTLILTALLWEDERARSPMSVTIDEIVADPVRYDGRSVIVSGEVVAAVSRRAFVMGGDDFGGIRLLVVSIGTLPVRQGRSVESPLAPQDIVQVSGEVRSFAIRQLERDFDIDLDDRLILAFEGQPAIIARSIVLTPRTGAAAIDTHQDDES
jgi:hypothetical protein